MVESTQRYFFTNDKGSKLILIISGSSVTGTFSTGVGLEKGIPKHVVGCKNGYTLSFTVNFEPVSTLCSWAGTLKFSEDGTEVSM